MKSGQNEGMTKFTGGVGRLRARDYTGEDSRTYLGEVTVDGGEILIADPAYIPQDRAVLLEQVHEPQRSRAWGGPVLVNPYRSEDRLAVAFRLESDGGYPVWAEQGPKGELLRVTIEVALPEQDESGSPSTS